MTEDELRRECESTVEHILDCVTALPDESLSVERGCAIARLLAFVRRMQAEAFREAADVAKGWDHGGLIAKDILARASELDPPGVPNVSDESRKDPGECSRPASVPSDRHTTKGNVQDEWAR